MNGAGYFTWRLPVEAVKLYRRNDPGTVAALRATPRRSYSKTSSAGSGTCPGTSFSSAILDDLRAAN